MTEPIEKVSTDRKQREVIIRQSFPRVTQFDVKRASGNEYTYYKVDCRSAKYGTTERKVFTTRKEAIDYAQDFAERITKNGAEPLIDPETKSQAEKYRALVERLAVYGKTPEEAATHYLRHLANEALQGIKPTVEELVDQYQKFKLLEKRDEQYENAIKLHCRYIKNTWGKLRIDELKRNDINAQLTKDKPHKGTRKHYLNHLRMFCRWAILEDKGYLYFNPAEGIKISPDRSAKEHFTAEETKNLLLLVHEIHPELIGYYAALVFVGLRPSEGERVKFSHINFQTHQLRVVGPEKDENGKVIPGSKTGERYCKLEPTALAWLKYHWEQCEKGTKPFIPSTGIVKKKKGYSLFNCEKEVRETFKARFGKWVPDICRHTAATHLVSLWEDEPKTAFYLGNSVAVIRKHYAKRLPQSEVEQFWKLTPSEVLPK